MESNGLLAPLFFVLVGLMVGALLKFALKKTALPYTVGLFAFGIWIGICDRLGWLAGIPFLKESIDFAGNFNPDMILYIFLPILIFDAAYELDVHIFRKTLLNATLLSVPGVVIAMLLTGVLMVGVGKIAPSYSEWNWTFAFMFGALISATDPVAVVALLKELGTSKRFSTLVDAESMLNDGTGIVLFMLFFGTYTTTREHLSPFVDFLFVVLVGALVGMVIAWLCIRFITKVPGDEMLQNSVMIFSAYMTFVLAQDYLNVSGVIALVLFGLTITYIGRPKLKPSVNRFMGQFWELATYLANTLIFILVGVIIATKVHFTWHDVLVLFGVYIGINLIRILMIALFYPVMKRSGYGLSLRESVILSWGGLRGALGLTLALMVSYTLPIPEPIRRQILFLTAGIVTLTLTINATTIGWLLKKLGLTEVPSSKRLLDYTVREQLREQTEKYFEDLKRRPALEDTDWATVRTFLPAREPAPQASVRPKDVLANIRLRVLDKERSFYWKLYSDGVISPGNLRRLTLAVDELYDKDGQVPLSERDELFDFCHKPFLWRIGRRFPFFKSWTDRHFQDRIIAGYDLARGLIIAQKEALKLVDELETSGKNAGEELAYVPVLKTEIQKNITIAQQFMESVATDYPRSYRAAVTYKSVRMLLSNEKRSIEQFREQGLLSREEADRLIDRLGDRQKDFSASTLLENATRESEKPKPNEAG